MQIVIERKLKLKKWKIEFVLVISHELDLRAKILILIRPS